jgi:hypothetical protein
MDNFATKHIGWEKQFTLVRGICTGLPMSQNFSNNANTGVTGIYQVADI